MRASSYRRPSRLRTARNSRRQRLAASRRSHNFEFEVESHIAREIFAVIYLAASFLLLLTIYGKLGAVGGALHNILKPVFGFGLHFIPLAFFGISVALFFSKKPIFSLPRITGISLLFISLLSIFHLSVPQEELLEQAKNGLYGGYIGFVSNFILRSALQIGSLGAAIIFIASLLIGALLTFEVSLIGFLKKAKPEIQLRRKAMAGDSEEDEEAIAEETREALDEINIIKPQGSSDDESDESYESLMTEEDDEDEEREDGAEESAETDVEAEAEESETESEEEDRDVPERGGSEKPEAAKATTARVIEWEFPPVDILENPTSAEAVDDELLRKKAETIRDKLSQFGIEVVMSDVHVGPTVIQYTLRPHEGVKLSKITTLKNDLALALAARAIRVEAPIPGKSLVGIEVPNEARSMVRLKEILEADDFKTMNSKLRLPLGRDVAGKPMIADLASMPHLLIAGATGAGKSVGINSFLLALLYQNGPHELKFIMIDPKRVELNSYNGIPHLLTPVITDVEKAAIALRWATAEMNRRYMVLSETGHRNIADYNADENILDKMPKIIILVDELADLMMAAGKEVEASICRIAQMARAVGLHLIVATQRPSVDVLTGLIKANMPARIAYAVTSGVDSRTILDGIGAEDLLGMGDMLFISGNMSKPVRIQGVYVSTKEIERVTNKVKLTMEPDYDNEITSGKVAQEKVQGLPASSIQGDNDPLFDKALQLVMESRKASASLFQRHLEVGYARAARILDEMEHAGLIGPVRGAKPRDIYTDKIEAFFGEE